MYLVNALVNRMEWHSWQEIYALEKIIIRDKWNSLKLSWFENIQRSYIYLMIYNLTFLNKSPSSYTRIDPVMHDIFY